MKIRFSQEVTVVRSDGDDDAEDLLITEPDILKTLDGIRYSEEKFTDYLPDYESASDMLRSNSIQGGVLSLRYDHELNKVLVETEYVTVVALSDEDIELLKDYTADQLGDGLGSNFLQFFDPEAQVELGFAGSYGETEVDVSG